MGLFEIVLLLAALGCGLVAGLLFGFAVVAMPGLGTLEDGPYLRAFQAMDRVIQDNQPLFMLAWLGSVVALLVATALGFGRLEGLDLGLLAGAAALYLLGVQLPTAAVNIPLNNALQALSVADATDEELRSMRAAFEPRWNRWNALRTGVAVAVTALLLVLLLRL